MRSALGWAYQKLIQLESSIGSSCGSGEAAEAMDVEGDTGEELDAVGSASRSSAASWSSITDIDNLFQSETSR